MKMFLTIPLVFVLASCQLGEILRPEPAPDDLTPRCGKFRYQGLVGQDAATLRDIDLPEKSRVVQPGMALTQDYIPDRLNISVNSAGIIDRVWCS